MLNRLFCIRKCLVIKTNDVLYYYNLVDVELPHNKYSDFLLPLGRSYIFNGGFRNGLKHAVNH